MLFKDFFGHFGSPLFLSLSDVNFKILSSLIRELRRFRQRCLLQAVAEEGITSSVQAGHYCVDVSRSNSLHQRTVATESPGVPVDSLEGQ